MNHGKNYTSSSGSQLPLIPANAMVSPENYAENRARVEEMKAFVAQYEASNELGLRLYQERAQQLRQQIEAGREAERLLASISGNTQYIPLQPSVAAAPSAPLSDNSSYSTPVYSSNNIPGSATIVEVPSPKVNDPIGSYSFYASRAPSVSGTDSTPLVSNSSYTATQMASSSQANPHSVTSSGSQRDSGGSYQQKITTNMGSFHPHEGIQMQTVPPDDSEIVESVADSIKSVLKEYSPQIAAKLLICTKDLLEKRIVLHQIGLVNTQILPTLLQFPFKDRTFMAVVVDSITSQLQQHNTTVIMKVYKKLSMDINSKLHPAGRPLSTTAKTNQASTSKPTFPANAAQPPSLSSTSNIGQSTFTTSPAVNMPTQPSRPVTDIHSRGEMQSSTTAIPRSEHDQSWSGLHKSQQNVPQHSSSSTQHHRSGQGSPTEVLYPYYRTQQQVSSAFPKVVTDQMRYYRARPSNTEKSNPDTHSKFRLAQQQASQTSPQVDPLTQRGGPRATGGLAGTWRPENADLTRLAKDISRSLNVTRNTSTLTSTPVSETVTGKRKLDDIAFSGNPSSKKYRSTNANDEESTEYSNHNVPISAEHPPAADMAIPLMVIASSVSESAASGPPSSSATPETIPQSNHHPSPTSQGELNISTLTAPGGHSTDVTEKPVHQLSRVPEVESIKDKGLAEAVITVQNSSENAPVHPPKLPLFLPSPSSSPDLNSAVQDLEDHSHGDNNDISTEDNIGSNELELDGNRSLLSSNSAPSSARSGTSGTKQKTSRKGVRAVSSRLHHKMKRIFMKDVFMPPPPQWVLNISTRHVSQMRGDNARVATETDDPVDDIVYSRRQWQETDVIALSRRCLHESPCMWNGCGVVLNSCQTLGIHAAMHAEDNEEWGSFACQWHNCSRKFSDGKKLSQHLVTHSSSLLFCCFEGCEETFETGADLLRHAISLKHRDTPFKTTEEPSKSVSLPSPPALSDTLPAYMSIPRHITRRPISKRVHVWLGARVAENISGFSLPGRKHSNAITPSRSSRRLADMVARIEAGGDDTEEARSRVLHMKHDEYDAFDNAGQLKVSKPCVPELSEEVSQLCYEGLVIWPMGDDHDTDNEDKDWEPRVSADIVPHTGDVAGTQDKSSSDTTSEVKVEQPTASIRDVVMADSASQSEPTRPGAGEADIEMMV